MALQLSIPSSDVGPGFPAAYARIAAERSVWPITFIFVTTYADSQARAEDKRAVVEREYQVPTDTVIGGNPYEACYAALKLLPEFAGAVDV